MGRVTYYVRDPQTREIRRTDDVSEAFGVPTSVCRDVIGPYLVSTVFLPIDHGFGSPQPVLFETMVFCEEKGFEEMDAMRYCTEDEAVLGHNDLVIKYLKKWKGESVFLLTKTQPRK